MSEEEHLSRVADSLGRGRTFRSVSEDGKRYILQTAGPRVWPFKTRKSWKRRIMEINITKGRLVLAALVSAIGYGGYTAARTHDANVQSRRAVVQTLPEGWQRLYNRISGMESVPGVQYTEAYLKLYGDQLRKLPPITDVQADAFAEANSPVVGPDASGKISALLLPYGQSPSFGQ